MNDKKNTITNIIAIVIAVATSANTYFESISTTAEINWITLGTGILTAVIAWYTGRDKDGKKKVA